MKHKVPIFLEYVWLLIAVISLGVFLYQWSLSSLEDGLPLLAIVFISILMYAFRRKLRTKNNQKES